MGYEFTAATLVLIVISGLAAGIINTIAGGGAMFTVPALMLLGMPADVANGTNRLSVVLQSAAGVHAFSRHGKLPAGDIVPLLAPTMAGTLVGAVGISYLSAELTKFILLGAMIVVALVLMFSPSAIATDDAWENFSFAEKPSAYFWMCLAGVYGGAIQGGVGFILLGVLVGVLRYDLLRGNALKLVCTSIFGLLSLVVFALRGQVFWLPGLVLSIATIIGVRLGVKFALSVPMGIIRPILLAVILGLCIAAWFRT